MEKNFIHGNISKIILRAFYNVYNELGSGFLEKIYENAMMIELEELGLNCKKQSPIIVYYYDDVVGNYYADIIVEDKIILELKAISGLLTIHEVQLVNYLKATDIEVGLLLNFGPKPQHIRKVLTKV